MGHKTFLLLTTLILTIGSLAACSSTMKIHASGKRGAKDEYVKLDTVSIDGTLRGRDAIYAGYLIQQARFSDRPYGPGYPAFGGINIGEAISLRNFVDEYVGVLHNTGGGWAEIEIEGWLKPYYLAAGKEVRLWAKDMDGDGHITITTRRKTTRKNEETWKILPGDPNRHNSNWRLDFKV